MFVWAAALPCIVMTCRPLAAVTPESPQVQRLVSRGLEFLETSSDQRLGARALVAMSLIKTGAADSHPQVLAAVEQSELASRGKASAMDFEDVYSVPLAIIFLCELGPQQHAATIQRLVALMSATQKSHGAWGYPEYITGDTSMTQYGVLSMWEARRAGFDVPDERVARVCNWLLRTQDPSGAWGYQGEDPGNFQLVEQTEVRPSLAAAGLGSVLICSDMLKIMPRLQPQRTDLPPALKPYRQRPEESPRSTRVDQDTLKEAVLRGNRWFEENYTISPSRYPIYYLYALERYMSFREVSEGYSPPDPSWYRDGYTYLARSQRRDGAWSFDCGPVPDTAFGVLFLIRSTKKRVTAGEGFGEGWLTGGRGLPSQLEGAQIRGGRVVKSSDGASIQELLSTLSGPGQDNLTYLLNNPPPLSLSSKEDPRNEDLEKLKAIVRQGEPNERVLAVRGLASTRDLNNVPVLLFALTDPDWRVARTADEGLRFISRKFEGVGFPEQPDEAGRRSAIPRWRQWYRTIRPHADLDE
ncbi:MAG: hypothetical protein WDZ59_12945 [Pirellulales bacterium]